MPFTLCHPAIVIPLHRYARQLTSLPALVIGSMAPDFVYFFSLGVSGSFTHSVRGVFLYGVPAGLAVYILYYALLRQALLAWLPPAISARMTGQVLWPLRSARTVCTVLASLAVGALTHIFWDSFTHANTVIVNRSSLLRSMVSLGAYEVPLFKVLQHVSSLIGFIVIAAYTLAWLKRAAPTAPHSVSMSASRRWLAVAAVSAAAAAGGAAGLVLRRAASIEHALFNVVVTGMAAAALAIVFLCIAWTVRSCRSAKQN